MNERADILSVPGWEAEPAKTDGRLHRALLWLLGCVLVALVANLALLVMIGSMFLEMRENRAESSEHQRLVTEMRKREIANAALILVEQERRLRKLRE